MRAHDLIWVLAAGLLLAAIADPLMAQDAPVEAPAAQAPAPAAPAATEKIASLEKQVQSLIGQVSRLASSQQAPANVEREKEMFAARFKAAKDQAGPGCRAAGGRLRAAVDSAGKVTVSCEW